MREFVKKLRYLVSREEKWKFSILFILMILASLLEVVGVGIIPAFISVLSDPGLIVEKFSEVGLDISSIVSLSNKDLLLLGSGIVFLVFLIKNSFAGYVSYTQARVTAKFEIRLGDRMFSAYMRAPYVYHLGVNTSELLRNVQESRAVANGVITPILQLLKNVMMGLFVLVLLITVEPVISVISVSALGIAAYLFVYVTRNKLERLGDRAQEDRKQMIKAVNQGLGAVADVRVMRRERFFVDEFKETLGRFADATRHQQFISSLTTPYLEFMAVVGMLGIAVSLALLGRGGIIPTLALFAVAIVRIRASFSAVLLSISQIKFRMVIVDLIYDSLYDLDQRENLQIARPQHGLVASTSPINSGIRVENVTFTYPGASEPALCGVNLTIEKGTSVGFVGPTGSGKTTMANVLLGLLTPEEGQIFLNGENIHSDLNGWFDKIGFIPQSVYLVDDSVRRNIALGFSGDDIDENRISEAIQVSQLTDFVNDLENGLDTVVGERGIRLSGGQRQRLGIARALYNRPEVLIMDEATSALDNLTEVHFMRALDHLRKNRTLIIIAHRLSTVQKCDVLYFINDGKIEASGTYDELRNSHKDFSLMVEMM